MISAFQEGIDTSLFFVYHPFQLETSLKNPLFVWQRLMRNTIFFFLQGSMILTILTKETKLERKLYLAQETDEFCFFLRFLGILDAEFYSSWVKMSRYSNDSEGISRILFDLCFSIRWLIRKPHNWWNYSSDLTHTWAPIVSGNGTPYFREI